MGRYRGTVTDAGRTQWLGPVEVEADDREGAIAAIAAGEGQTPEWFESVGLTEWTVERVGE